MNTDEGTIKLTSICYMSMINITQDYEELQGATQASETCPNLLKEF
jgi:hypothetical protein